MSVLHLLLYASCTFFQDTLQIPDSPCSDSLRAPAAINSSDTASPKLPADSSGKHISWSAQFMAFGRTTNFTQASGSVNPGNNVAQLNKYDGGVYFRPELKYENNSLGIWIKPRLNIDMDADEESLFKRENYTGRLYFQELKAKWQINKSLYLLAGRYVKFLGTSSFFNPCNPYLADNVKRLNVKLELEPMDFVELNLSTKTNWSYSFIANISSAGEPVYKEPFLKFKRSYGLFAEYYGASASFGLLASIDEAKKCHFGAYGNRNLNEATVIWTDFSLDYNTNRFYPVPGHYTGLLNYEMVNGAKNEKLFFTGLIGASYTLNSGPTIQAEYLYNGKGYNAEEFGRYKKMIKSSSDYSFDITKELSKLNLGRSINTGIPYLRRNYIFLQAGDNEVFEKLNYNLRYLYSIDDHGSQLSSLVEWNVSNNIQIYAVELGNFGKKTDLNKLINFQLMIGLIYKM